MKLNEGRTWPCNSIPEAAEGPITTSTISTATLIQDIQPPRDNVIKIRC